MTKGYIHVYTGDGKGKTTAAVGLAIRAVGAGKKVCILQFMKSLAYSEQKILQSLPGITLIHWANLTSSQRKECSRMNSEKHGETIFEFILRDILRKTIGK